GLDLDRDEVAAGLDDEVHLLARRRSPVEDLGALDPRVPPAQQVVQHEVFEVSAGGLGRAAQVQGQARVAPVELGGFDEALGAVHRVRWYPDQQVRRLEQVEVPVHGGLRQRHVAGQLGLVDELTQTQA